MNVFCYPGVLRNGGVSGLLGAAPGVLPCFGYKARVPFANGKFDRTEVDLRLGDVLVEAKLTESDFHQGWKGFWLCSGRFEVVVLFGMLSLVAQFAYWSRIVRGLNQEHA